MLKKIIEEEIESRRMRLKREQAEESTGIKDSGAEDIIQAGKRKRNIKGRRGAYGRRQ